MTTPAPHIAILCDGHLSMNPRVVKEADALQACGFRVTVLYQALHSARVAEDQQILASADWQGHCYLDLLSHPRRRWWKLQRAIAQRLLQIVGRVTPAVWGYGPERLRRHLRQLNPDLAIAHREMGLWALHSLRDHPMVKGCDIEDWYSDDSASAHWPPVQRRAMQKLEGWALGHCRYRLTTSEAMAGELGQVYGCTPPLPVANSFALGMAPERSVWAGDRPLRLHWFSQTIGPGRGLELIFEALRELPLAVELHLRGDLPERYRPWLEQQTRDLQPQQLVCHPRLPPTDLPASLQAFDIGLALEIPDSRNKALTSSNKVFQYLEAGLPVLATDTPGQREVLERLPGCGWMVAPGPEAVPQIRHLLQQCFTQPQQVAEAARRARALPSTTLGWRQQQARIVDAARLALGGRPTPTPSRGR